MYKLTFDDKPEANLYAKWARQKGYFVEGPYRERLSKASKKFDVNGKRIKYRFVVLRKKAVGKEGGSIDQYAEAYKWFRNAVKSTQGFHGSWSEIRHRVWEKEGGTGFPPRDWDLPKEYMVAYLRIVQKEPIDKALKRTEQYQPRTVTQAKAEFRERAKTTTDYFETNPEEIRKIATKMGIPADKPLPKVLVMGKGAGKEYSETPMLQKSSLEADKPSGYVITIPESMLKRVRKKGDDTNYILGSRVKENIRHELAHYEERSKAGAETGTEKTPYDEAVKEIKMDMRAKVKSMPRALALQSYRLKEKYGLDDKAAFEVIEKAAKDLGVKKGTITRARGWDIKSTAEGRIETKVSKGSGKKKEAKEIPIQPEIKKVMAGEELKPAGKKEPWQMTEKEYDEMHQGRVPLPSTRPEGGYAWMPARYLRFSRPPAEGASTNWYLEKPEKGVSIYKAWFDPKTKLYVMETPSGDIVGTQQSLIASATEKGKKIYEIEGELLKGETGFDLEDLLKTGTARIKREVSPHEIVTADDPWMTISGEEVKPPEWEESPEKSYWRRHKREVEEAVKEKRRVPLRVLREHRDVVKEEREERKRAKKQERERKESRERAEKAEKEEAKYWEETKLSEAQMERTEEVEALKKEAEEAERAEKEARVEEIIAEKAEEIAKEEKEVKA